MSPTDDSIFSGASLSPYPRDITPSEIPCAACGRYHACGKSYNLHHLIFLWFIVAWERKTCTLCPGCARWALLRRLMPGIIISNLLAPFWLVWWLVQFARTLR